MVKLIVVIMGQNCQKFIKMCLESVKDADEIVYCDGGSNDNTFHIVNKFEDARRITPTIINNKWNSEDKQMNGKQRNFYLDYLKKNYPNDWALVLDADEVVEDLSKIKEFIQTAEPGLYSPKMRHFIGDLGHEDATVKEHWVFNRLFKISSAKAYPLDSHPILTGDKEFPTRCTTIWHLGHLPVEYMHYIIKRTNQNLSDSTIHTKEFIQKWRNAHLYGVYPTSSINLTEIPKVILDNFKIDFDELYFRDRKEMKAQHYQDAIDWKNYFNPSGIFVYGCGLGQRVKVLNEIGCLAVGFELSEYAVKNKLYKDIFQDDIINLKHFGDSVGLTVAYDLLEHLNYEDLDKAIDNLIHYSKKHILISVPFKGTPNCEADPTHKIKEDKDWWVKQFTDKGLVLIKTPNHFQYKEQILIFKKGGENGKKEKL